MSLKWLSILRERQQGEKRYCPHYGASDNQRDCGAVQLQAECPENALGHQGQPSQRQEQGGTGHQSGIGNINEDFRSQFNSDWAGKLLIVVDEVLLNRREDSERLKNLSTTLSYKVEAKVKTVTKSAEPPCKVGR